MRRSALPPMSGNFTSGRHDPPGDRAPSAPAAGPAVETVRRGFAENERASYVRVERSAWIRELAAPSPCGRSVRCPVCNGRQLLWCRRRRDTTVNGRAGRGATRLGRDRKTAATTRTTREVVPPWCIRPRPTAASAARLRDLQLDDPSRGRRSRGRSRDSSPPDAHRSADPVERLKATESGLPDHGRASFEAQQLERPPSLGSRVVGNRERSDEHVGPVLLDRSTA